MKNLTNFHFKSLQRIGLLLLLIARGTGWAQQTSPLLPLPLPTTSTVPGIGDVNPYGLAFAPVKFAAGYVLQPHDLLISNFNDAQNLQGTGTTLMRVGSNGLASLFYQGQASGLTAAIGIVRAGYVLVGNLPTADGTSATVQPGSLQVVDGNGHLFGSLINSNINGPWGMAVQDNGTSAHVFVSNVLSGTIVRIDMGFPSTGGVNVIRTVVIGTGFTHRTDPAALVLGPSGLAFDSKNNILYVASSTDNAIYALIGAATAKASLGAGTLVYQDPTHLHGPAQMAWAPNGHLLVANSDGSNADPNQPSEIVEFTTTGQFVAQYSIDANNGGAFGVAVDPIGVLASRIAATDANQNSVTTSTELAH